MIPCGVCLMMMSMRRCAADLSLLSHWISPVMTIPVLMFFRSGLLRSGLSLVVAVGMFACVIWAGPMTAAQSATSTLLAAPTVNEQVIPIFDDVPIEFERGLPDGTERNGHRLFKEGQVVQATIDLPKRPANQRDAQRIIATIHVEPVILEADGKLRPGDPWTRLGALSVMSTAQAGLAPVEVELTRFITGFGGRSTFTQDLTALAPILQGKTVLRVSISTYSKPAWKITVMLSYSGGDAAGYRRPMWAVPVWNEPAVTAERNTLTATVDVPAGLARPRLRVMSSGHASDGTGGDEFISRIHILRVDGLEIARWRPWSEDGGSSKSANPMSGRIMLDGRELWSSDLDRSGWRPGSIVEPLRLPVPELTPGKHTIEIEVQNIRPKDQTGQHGYWRISCIAVADEPWPNDPEPPR